MNRGLLLVGGGLCLLGFVVVLSVVVVGGHFGVVSDWVRAALDATLPGRAG